MVTWLLGPPGDLRELETPETGISITEVRYGGIHQGLNGARAMDVTGVKTDVTLTFQYLEEDDYRWLQALHTRHIPGAHRLINPLRKNRMSMYAASCNPTPSRRHGVWFSAGVWDWVNDWPTAAGPGRRSALWTGRTASSTAYFDVERRESVVPGETITASVYLKGSTSFTATLQVDWLDQYGAAVSSSTTENAAVTTSWTRFSITRTAPTGAYLGRLKLSAVSTNDIGLAAAQWETGSTATTWDQGGGEIEVLIDQMPATSPRFPLMNCSVTLLEV